MMMVNLIEKISEPQNKYLIFTSAGNNSNIHKWLQGEKKFDLWINNYSNKSNLHLEHSDYYMEKKGGKFPVLHYCYQHWKSIFDQYEFILVSDDDLVIDATNLSNLFDISKKYGLSISQPSFHPKGKISHAITRKRPFSLLRHTNFVENTCPLFSKPKLDVFMQVYNPALVGWGIDWWYLFIFKEDIAHQKVAVIDSISCINPHDFSKNGTREINTLQKKEDRIETWEKIKKEKEIDIKEWHYEKYNQIPLPFKWHQVFDACSIFWIRSLNKLKSLAK